MSKTKPTKSVQRTIVQLTSEIEEYFQENPGAMDLFTKIDFYAQLLHRGTGDFIFGCAKEIILLIEQEKDNRTLPNLVLMADAIRRARRTPIKLKTKL